MVNIHLLNTLPYYLDLSYTNIYLHIIENKDTSFCSQEENILPKQTSVLQHTSEDLPKIINNPITKRKSRLSLIRNNIKSNETISVQNSNASVTEKISASKMINENIQSHNITTPLCLDENIPELTNENIQSDNITTPLDENLTELTNENIELPNIRPSSTLQIGGGAANNENFRFKIVQEFEKRVDKFNVIGEETVIQIDEISNGENVLTWLETVMKDVHTYIMRNTSNDQFIGISIRCNNFTRGSAGLSFRPASDLTYESIWDVIHKIYQSNESFVLAESFLLSVTRVNNICGKGRNKKSDSIEILSKKSIISITNSDDLCLFRALVVGEYYLKKSQIDKIIFRKVSQKLRTTNEQRIQALELLKNTIQTVPANGCGFYELKQIQDYYIKKGIGIVVYEKSLFGHGAEPVFNGVKIIEETCNSYNSIIYLLYVESQKHYHLIINLIGAGGNKYFCWMCNKAYKTVNGHNCVHKCSRCFSTPICQNTERRIICQYCNREFYGQKCFENHMNRATRFGLKTICEKIYFCKQCLKTVNVDDEKHECEIQYCKMCHKKHKSNELCYMQISKPKNYKKKTLFYFYDFETRQDDSYKDHLTSKIHIVNLCVVQKVVTIV